MESPARWRTGGREEMEGKMERRRKRNKRVGREREREEGKGEREEREREERGKREGTKCLYIGYVWFF